MTANNEHRNNKKKREDGDKKRAKQPQLQKKKMKKLGKLALQDQKIQELERCIQVRILPSRQKTNRLLFPFDSIILSPSLSLSLSVRFSTCYCRQFSLALFVTSTMTF